MIELLKSALVSGFVSALISGIGVYYLHAYLDGRRRESEQAAAKRREERRKADALESQRRRAAGRLLFWLHDAVVKGKDHANGDLEKAYQDYNNAEDDQKRFEQMLLAEHHDENRSSV